MYWSSFVPVNDGRFWGWGSNWQSSAESVVFGTMHRSSLLLDEERSELNKWTYERIVANDFKYMNMLGIDNVCHHGPDIFDAMQLYNAQSL